MKTSLFVILFLLQGIPVPPQQGGNVSGILTDAGGKPLSAVRVTAVAVPQTAADAANGSVMGAVTQTDALGRYQLENIPPGRYYIAAGRLDLPTYFPGTQEMREGTVLTVGAGTSTDGIVFRLQDSSQGRATAGVLTSQGPPFILIPIDVRVVDGEAVPVLSEAGNVMLEFDDGSGAHSSFSVDSPFLRVEGPGPREFRVSVRNLPEGFVVDAVRQDTADLRVAPLKLPDSLWKGPSANTSFVYSSAGLIFSGLTIGVFQTVPANSPPLSVVYQANGANLSPPLAITLRRLPPGPRTGVTVRGQLSNDATSISLSARKGLVFADGRFEFANVPEGVHTVVVFGSSSPRVASLIVGKDDIQDVQLQRSPVIPQGYEVPRLATPVEQRAPGTVLPMASLRGRVIDAETKAPLAAGSVFLTGGSFGTSRDLNANGEFEIQALLPGTYNIEVQPFEHRSVSQMVVVAEDSSPLNIESAEVPR